VTERGQEGEEKIRVRTALNRGQIDPAPGTGGKIVPVLAGDDTGPAPRTTGLIEIEGELHRGSLFHNPIGSERGGRDLDECTSLDPFGQI